MSQVITSQINCKSMTSKLKCLEIIEVDTDEPIEDKAEENEVEILGCPNVKSSIHM